MVAAILSWTGRMSPRRAWHWRHVPGFDRLSRMPTTRKRHLRSPQGRAFAAIVASVALIASSCASADGPRDQAVRVMTFNLWHGGDAGGQPLEQSVEVIRQAGADIVGLQETHGRGPEGQRPDHGARMATMLGWHYVDQGGRTGTLSRWPISSTLGHPAGGS